MTLDEITSGLYLNFMYFNIGRIVYLQTDVVVPYLLLAPTIIAGKITLGAMNQILNAFTQVRTSFQYLVNSWSTIVRTNFNLPTTAWL